MDEPLRRREWDAPAHSVSGAWIDFWRETSGYHFTYIIIYFYVSVMLARVKQRNTASTAWNFAVNSLWKRAAAARPRAQHCGLLVCLENGADLLRCCGAERRCAAPATTLDEP